MGNESNEETEVVETTTKSVPAHEVVREEKKAPGEPLEVVEETTTTERRRSEDK